LFAVLLVSFVLLVVMVASREGPSQAFGVVMAVMFVVALFRGSRAVTDELSGRATSGLQQKPSHPEKASSRSR
jgi:hypothetical protein